MTEAASGGAAATSEHRQAFALTSEELAKGRWHAGHVGEFNTDASAPSSSFLKMMLL